MLYNLDEICLIPAKTTDIEHRHQVFIYDENNKLPIFTAPMHSVINIENREVFEDAGINTIIPRTINWNERYNYIKHGKWTAVGFKEAEYILNNYKDLNEYTIKICIDQANGHMSKLLNLCSELKNKFNKISIMTGNIANPNTYELYARHGIDYVRVGIGGGNACFIAGTKVTMDNGYKNIEDIIPGDIVMTTSGQKCVKNTFNKYVDRLITINNNITCTADHKFLVINKSDKDLVTEQNLDKYSFYIEANNLTDDYLLVQV